MHTAIASLVAFTLLTTAVPAADRRQPRHHVRQYRSPPLPPVRYQHTTNVRAVIGGRLFDILTRW